MINPKANIIIFEPLSIRTNKPKEVFDNYRDEISKKIVEAILHCIKFGKSKTVFAEIIVPKTKEIICLNVEENNFLDVLTQNLDVLVENEEYELCAEILKEEAIDNLIGTIKNL